MHVQVLRRETAVHAAAQGASVVLFDKMMLHVARSIKAAKQGAKRIDTFPQWTDHGGDTPLHHVCRRTDGRQVLAILRLLPVVCGTRWTES